MTLAEALVEARNAAFFPPLLQIPRGALNEAMKAAMPDARRWEWFDDTEREFGLHHEDSGDEATYRFTRLDRRRNIFEFERVSMKIKSVQTGDIRDESEDTAKALIAAGIYEAVSEEASPTAVSPLTTSHIPQPQKRLK